MQDQIQAVIDPIFIVGPMKAHLPDEITAHLLEFCKTEAPTAKDYTPYLAGRITEGRQLGLPLEKLSPQIAELLIALSYHYLEQLAGQQAERPQYKLELLDLWMVEQKAGDFNPVHQHGGLLAGIIYLQVPPECDIMTKEGCLEFLFGRHNPMTADFCGQRTIKPVPGDLYIFPAWLQHVVYPFKGEGSRICMPFNVKHVA